MIFFLESFIKTVESNMIWGGWISKQTADKLVRRVQAINSFHSLQVITPEMLYHCICNMGQGSHPLYF